MICKVPSYILNDKYQMVKNLLMSTSLLFFGLSAVAQVPGRWEGTAQVNGQSLPIAFTIVSTGVGSYSATMDVPAQGAKALPCDDVRMAGDSLFILIKMIGGRYTGRLDTDRLATTGTLRQGTFSTPLNLKRTGEGVPLTRPQTPQPPFSYLSENVEYDNKDQAVHLGATLTKPSGAGPFPAAILISGSGAQDRDEALFGHKPFWVIADYLTRRGVAVLRVDDRGTGKSIGPTQGTSADFAQDVMTSLDFLQKRKDIDPKKTGLIGHSEGGMIAPIVAAKRPNDVAFIISLAGPGEPILDLMEKQNTAALKSIKVTESVAESYGTMMRKIMEAAITESDSAAFIQKTKTVLSAWKSGVHPNVVASLTGITDSTSQQRFLNTLDKSLRAPWMQYFLAYNPTETVKKITCPVLVLNGEKDIQVLAKSNLAGWKTALEKSKNKDVTVKEMPGLNHLFQQCTTCTTAEYGELTETFSPEVLQLMGDWLTKRVGK